MAQDLTLPAACTLEVVDESGQLYATRPCPGTMAEAPCGIEQLGVAPAVDNVQRVAVALSTPPGSREYVLSAWGEAPDRPLVDLRVASPPEGGLRLAELPLPAVQGAPMRITLRHPGAEAPLCEASFPATPPPAP